MEVSPLLTIEDVFSQLAARVQKGIPARVPLTAKRFGASVQSVGRMVERIQSSIDYWKENPPAKPRDVFELSEHWTSLTFTVGVEGDDWKALAYLTSCAAYHSTELEAAVSYGILSGNMSLRHFFKNHISGQMNGLGLVMCQLADIVESNPPMHSEKELLELISDPNVDQFGFCQLLLETIHNRQFGPATQLLEALVTFRTDSEDWMDSQPEYFPEFEPVECGIARIAIEKGLSPSRLSEVAKAFYGPAFL